MKRECPENFYGVGIISYSGRSVKTGKLFLLIPYKFLWRQGLYFPIFNDPATYGYSLYRENSLCLGILYEERERGVLNNRRL